MRKLCLLALTFLTACVEEGKAPLTLQTPSPATAQREKASLDVHAQAYILYLKEVGNKAPAETKNIPHPLAESCQKIINGEVVAHGAFEVVQQMADARLATDPWNINVLGTFPAPEHGAATLIYDIHAKPLGSFHVIKVVHFNAQGKVTEIRENYVRLKN